MATSYERVVWEEEQTEKLLDICIEIKATPKTKINWGKIVTNLNLKTGKKFTEKQCRNHYDDLRKKFKIWEEMELKWTGLAFDPITGCPEVEQDDRWNAFVKRHKGIPARFLKKPLHHLPKLRALYSGSFASSKWSFSPTSNINPFDNKDLNVENNSSGDKDVEDNVEEVKNMWDEENDSHLMVCKRKADVCVSKVKKQKKSDIDSCLELLKMSLQANTMEKNSNKYEKVSAVLNNMIMPNSSWGFHLTNKGSCS